MNYHETVGEYALTAAEIEILVAETRHLQVKIGAMPPGPLRELRGRVLEKKTRRLKAAELRRDGLVEIFGKIIDEPEVRPVSTHRQALLREQLAILDHRVGELEKMPVGALTGALVARKLAELRAERHHLRTVLVKAFAETDAAAAEE